MRKKIACVCIVLCICAGAYGCESVARKFVRKPKEQPKPQDIVLEPQEYGAMKPSARELYDQYYLYWKSWQDEFVTTLSGTSHKRQADSIAEALKNLAEMRQLLDDQAKQKLDIHIRELEQLGAETAADAYYAHGADYAARAEKIRRQIMSDFSPDRIKDHIA
jgi:hypothetical protein